MGDYTQKLAKKATEKLLPGETLIAAVRALPSGGIAATAISAAGVQVGGALGTMAADKLGTKLTKAGEAEAEAAGFPLAKQMVLGLTDRRLTVWNRSIWTGSPKMIIGAVPIENIACFEGTPGKLKHSLVIGFVDGSSVTVDVPKIDGTEAFVGAFGSVKRSGTQTAVAV
jgi:hypothetical protein